MVQIFEPHFFVDYIMNNNILVYTSFVLSRNTEGYCDICTFLTACKYFYQDRNLNSGQIRLLFISDSFYIFRNFSVEDIIVPISNFSLPKKICNFLPYQLQMQ